MSRSRKSQLQSVKDYLEFAVYRCLELILKPFPVAVIFVSGLFLGAAAWMILTKRRRLVIRNLRIAFGEQCTAEEIKKLCFKNFCLTGANLFCSIKCALCSEKKISSMVTVEGLDYLLNSLGLNKGCIIVLGHMGNWEILAQLPSIVSHSFKNVSHKVGGIYRPLNNPHIDSLIKRRRQKRNAILLSKFDGFTKFTSFIKSGGALAILSDQRAGKHGHSALFFGRITSCSPLPEMLYKKTQAPAVALSLKTVGLAKWSLEIIPVRSPLTTQNCTATLEEAFRKSPVDVFWMHDRWRIERKRPLAPENRKKQIDQELSAKCTKPFRLVIALPSHSQSIPDHIIAALNKKRPDITTEFLIEKSESIPTTEAYKTIYYPADATAKEIGDLLIRSDQEEAHPIDAILLLSNEIRLHQALSKPELPLPFSPHGKGYQKLPEEDKILSFLGLD